MFFEAVDVPCSGPFHCFHIADYIYDFCRLPGPYVGLSVLVCDVEYIRPPILISILVCAAASLFCACLVSNHVSAPHGIAGSTKHDEVACFSRRL